MTLGKNLSTPVHRGRAIREESSTHHASTSCSPDAHTEFLARRFFGSLNGLRALSVMAVIWHHAGPEHSESLPYVLVSGGAQGVTLFFAISGFLIVTLLLRERDRTGKIDLKGFYIRRSLRIFPLYYAVIALYMLVVFAVERNSQVGKEFFQNLPFFLTYTSNWFVLLEGRVIFYFAWSLAAEEQFYLVWPAIQKFFSPKRAMTIVCVAIVVVATTQLLSAGGALVDRGLLHRIVVGIPLAICIGVVLAHALHHRRSFDALGWFFSHRWSAVVWLALFLGCLSWQAAPTVLIHSLAVMFVGACVYREDHCLASILRFPAIAHVGAVSYGVYLLHMLTKNAVGLVAASVQLELPTGGLFVLTAVISIGLASLSFRYYESIFLRMKNRYAGA